jgi:hypothetical protein
MNTEINKKAYTKPEIDEVGRLNRFVNENYNQNNNDSKKFTFPTGQYILFEKNS